MLVRTVLSLSLLVHSIPSKAEDTTSNEPKITETKPDALRMPSSQDLRRSTQYYLGGSYSYIDLLIPGKIGINAEWISDVDHSFGGEYLQGAVSIPFIISDLGSFSEKRVSLIARYFTNQNSLNVFWLIANNRTELKLGSSILEAIPGSHAYSTTMISTETLGLGAGLGNRWQHRSGATLAVDWFSWTQPLLSLKTESSIIDQMVDEGDKDRAKRALKVMSYFPRVVLAKVQFGLSF